MSYSFMSNIHINDEFNSPDDYYQEVGKYNINTSTETPENGVIVFNNDNIQRKAKFLMIRAGTENDFIIQLSPSNYCVHIPAGELWSVDSIDEIDKFYIKNIFYTEFSTTTKEKISTTTADVGKLQWMIGYK